MNKQLAKKTNVTEADLKYYLEDKKERQMIEFYRSLDREQRMVMLSAVRARKSA